MRPRFSNKVSRRQFLVSATLAGGGTVAAQLFSQSGLAQSAPAVVTSERMRPGIPYGVASGDITTGSAVIWSRSDRPARMIVEYAIDESFRNASRIIGPAALENMDYTARVNLTGLPDGQQQIFYRVTFQDLTDVNVYSEPVTGTFRTIPKAGEDILFAWSGDTAGQGWGINPEWGGMKIYETIRQLNPNFFVHCGDYIYADGPIKSEVTLEDGTIWRNVTIPEKDKVAETLPEFRGNYIYNLMDENVRRFNAEIPQLVQWDDHETTNNWYPNEQLLSDDRYSVKSVALLSARAKQAFLEYIPIRLNASDPEQIYRSFSFGPALDIFMIDMRSYRGNNSPNRQAEASSETAFLGNRQLEWLKQSLRNSTATWKVISSDMPIGLVVPDGESGDFENLANGDGPALGREMEIADLLRFIKQNNLRNVVWITADVHYAAAHYYDPSRAQFQDFHPFWEFVSGPLHSGTFGPNDLDNTFGPQVMFQSVPEGEKFSNLPPSAGFQFFGTVKIDGTSRVMTVAQHNLQGEVLYSVELTPS